MLNTATKLFNTRAFVALMIAFSGLGLPITGVANHLHQFSPMTVDRHAWMAAHNSLGGLFAVFSVWHIVLNRRALIHYIQGLAAGVPQLSREAKAAAAVVAATLFLFAGHAFHAR